MCGDLINLKTNLTLKQQYQSKVWICFGFCETSLEKVQIGSRFGLFFLTFLSGFSLDFTLFSFYVSSTNNGIREGKALSGVKAPLGLAHVKKRKDKKSFRKA